MIEYCVFCQFCNSPILLGSLHGVHASMDVHFTLADIHLTCQSCEGEATYKGTASIFSHSGKYAYWGVICECGEFQPLLRASLDPRERRPDVQPFKILCRHRAALPVVNPIFEQALDKSHLKKIEQDEEVKNFHPYPLRLRS